MEWGAIFFLTVAVLAYGVSRWLEASRRATQIWRDPED